MAERFVVIFDGTSDARCPLDRTNAHAAGIGSDSTDSYQLKFRKNGTLKKVVDEDTILSLAATKAGYAAAPARQFGMAVVPLAGATIHGGVQAWANPESGKIIITGVYVDVQTIATAAATLEVGTTAVSNTTASANLIDTVDVHSATGVFDNFTDKGTNGKSRQLLAVGAWVTFSQASGDTTGLVGNLYIEYFLE